MLDKDIMDTLVSTGIAALNEGANAYGREKLYTTSVEDAEAIIAVLNRRADTPFSGLLQCAAIARALATGAEDYARKTGHPAEVYYALIVTLAASLYPGGIPEQGTDDEQQGHPGATERKR